MKPFTNVCQRSPLPAVAQLRLVRPMSGAQRVIVIVLATALLCHKTYAPIYGTYPGLRSLIKDAESSQPLTILDKLSEDRYGRLGTL